MFLSFFKFIKKISLNMREMQKDIQFSPKPKDKRMVILYAVPISLRPMLCKDKIKNSLF